MRSIVAVRSGARARGSYDSARRGPRRSFAGLALLAAALCVLGGCRRAAVRARCVVRVSGSYCTFQNVGDHAGQACFLVRVRTRPGRAVRTETRACSGPLAPGEQSAPYALQFPGDDPFAGCAQDAVTNALTDCESEVVVERAQPL